MCLRSWLCRIGFWGAGIAVALACVLDWGLGRDVILIAPHAPAVVKVNRALYTSGDAVADLYGNALSKPVRVIFPSETKLIVPPEDPYVLLLSVDKQRGENPLQAQTIWFFAKFAVGGFLVLGGVGLLLSRLKSHPAG